jgi:hypothetical protein
VCKKIAFVCVNVRKVQYVRYSVCIILYIKKYIYIHIIISLSVCLPACLSVCLSACLPVYLRACVPAKFRFVGDNSID